MNKDRARYWVFGGCKYYPDGGMADFKASYASFDEAKGFASGYVRDDAGGLNWAHVWDSQADAIVWGEKP